ncbi:MAG TPA: DUF4097 family beta strand repeat-containing protein [Phnomibacter sp.]|nr:DUF4097 family beta strand repeat-containing protein [Phnomibacter sp.]
MKNFLCTVFFITGMLAGTLLQAQDKTPYSVTPFTAAAVKQVEVKTSGGSIQVQYKTAEASRVEVYIRSNGNNEKLSKEEIDARLAEYYDYRVEVSGNTLYAIAKTKGNINNWKKTLSISFVIYTAQKVNTLLQTSGGSINLSALDGEHEFATSGGSLKLAGMRGQLKGSTSGGSINLEDVNANGSLQTSGGSIQAKTSKGNLSLRTSGGSLKLEDLDGKIDATTSGGSVTASNIAGELKTATSGGSIRAQKMHCNLDAATSGGSINIEMDALKDYVRVNNSAGNINITIPAASKVNLDLSGQRISVPNLTNFSGNASDKSINGTVNGGGANVTVSGHSGQVTLQFK